MDKKIKDYIAAKKLTDEEIYKLLTAESQNADASETSETTKDSGKVEQTGTTDQSTAAQSGAEIPDKDAFTKEELFKMFDERIEAREKKKAENAAKEQTNFSPVIDNPNKDKPLYRILKMNR